MGNPSEEYCVVMNLKLYRLGQDISRASRGRKVSTAVLLSLAISGAVGTATSKPLMHDPEAYTGAVIASSQPQSNEVNSAEAKRFLTPRAELNKENHSDLDWQGVIHQLRHAYRADLGAFKGGGDAYEVLVEGGRIRLGGYAASSQSPNGSRQPLELGAFQTIAITRGKQNLLSATVMEVGPQGELQLDHGEVVEVLKNGTLGVEQSWAFLNKPMGEGDLVIRVAVDGSTWVASTDDGLHFASSSNQLGVRYGNGTLIDRNGVRVSIPARYEDGNIVLRVGHAVLERIDYPSVLDPTISPEFDVSVPVFSPAAGNQTKPAITATDSEYFVVWFDERASKVIGARVSKEGKTLDPNGIVIGESAHGAPTVAWNGENYVVVWTDNNQPGSRVVAKRFDRKGTPLERDAIVLRSSDQEYYENPKVAWGGKNSLVVWQTISDDWEEGYEPHPDDIYGTRLSKTGQVLDSTPIAIAVASDGQMNPSVVSTSDGFFVVWQDLRKPGRNQANPGTEDEQDGWGFSEIPDVFGARVSNDGILLDPNGIEIETSDAGQVNPDVAFDGVNLWVVWEDWRNSTVTGSDIYGVKVSKDGHVDGGGAVAISLALRDQVTPKVTRTDDGYLVIWQDLRNCGQFDGSAQCGDVYGTRIDTDGRTLDSNGVLVFSGKNRQALPQIASIGSESLVVWEDDSIGTSMYYPNEDDNRTDIFGARMSSNGKVYDKTAITIAGEINTTQSAAAAFDGNNYFIVWQDSRSFNDSAFDIYGARVSPTGELLDGSGIAICTNPSSQLFPDVAWNGSEYLVAWTDERNNNPDDFSTQFNRDIYGARVSADGKVIDPSNLAISLANDTQERPKVASDGKDFFVVWSDYRNEAAPVVDIASDVYGARVKSDGTLPDPNGLVVSDAERDQSSPQIIWGNGEYFVVWTDRRPGTTTTDIYGRRLSKAGKRIGEDIAIGTAKFQQTNPTVTWNGTEYFVVWMDSRNTASASNNDSDLFGARISKSGELLDKKGIAVTTDSPVESDPRVIWDGTNYVVVWEQRTDKNQNATAIYALRVASEGKVLDSKAWDVAPASDVRRQAVLAAGTQGQLLVVYHSLAYEATRIYGRFFFPEEVSPSDNSGNDSTSDRVHVVGGCDCRMTSTQRHPVSAVLLVISALGLVAGRRRASSVGRIRTSRPQRVLAVDRREGLN
jgi:hypothetical protein